METRKASAGTILCFSHKYYFSLYFINYNDITWRSRIIGQCSVELYLRNVVILHCGGPKDPCLFPGPH